MLKLVLLCAWCACALVPSAASAREGLSGTVRAVDGSAVADASVTLHQGAQSRSAVTGSNGSFVFPGAVLPAAIDVTAPGFAPFHRDVDASPVAIVLAPASVAESIVVTGDARPAWRDPSTGVTVLGRSDLDALPAVTPDEALRVVSGFSLFRRSSAVSANPTTHGVTMRGLSASGASRGLVMLDGTPLNDGFGGWVTWTRLPPNAIARIDVQRGASGDAFGSDALGGVIRVATADGSSSAASVGGELGNQGVDAADLSAGGRQGGLSMFGAASWFRTDGTVPVAPESRGAVDRPASARWANGFGRADLVGSGRRLTFSGWGGRDERGNGTVLQRNRMSGGTFSTSFDALGSRTSFAARVAISPNHFYQTFSSVSSSRATETLTSAQTIGTNAVRALAEFGSNLPRGHVLVRAALTHEHADFTDNRPTSTSTQSLVDDGQSIAAQAGFAPVARLTLNGGARREWRTSPKSSSAADAATVGHLAAAWRLSGPVFLRGSVASSHRWATLNELVRNFQVGNTLTVANADLKPERAASVDASIGVERSRWQASIGAFHSVVQDAIANVTQPSGSVAGFTGIVRKRENAGEAHANGLELDGEARPLSALRVRASAAVTGARFRQSKEPALEGKVLPQVPRVSFSFDADVRLPHAVTTSAVWHAVSSQFDDDRNQFRLASASQLDVQVAGRIRDVGWTVVVENATDARIEVGRTPLVTLAPPRSVRVGFDWRFR